MNPSVSHRTAIAAALFVASGTLAFAQTTATTDPVGFFTKALAASGGSTRVSSTVSFPLYRPPVYTAAATSVTDGSPDSTCQLNGFNAATTDVVTNPHLLRVKAATDTTHIGRFLLISAAAGDQLTIGGVTSLSTFVSVGDTCEVLPANTLGSLFGTGNPPVANWLVGASATVADNVFIWNGSTWFTYFHNGTSWRRTGNLSSQNGTIIYPDEGVFISRLGTSAVDLISTGTVPTTTERTDLSPAGSTFISNRFPVDMQLVNVGLHLTAGWVSGASANVADKAFAWNGSTWDTYYYNGTNWKKTGSLANQNTTVIPAGTAVFVTRAGVSTSTLAQSLPYTP